MAACRWTLWTGHSMLLAYLSIVLLPTADLGPCLARVTVVLAEQDDDWLREEAPDPRLDLARDSFTLAIGERTLAAGSDLSAIDPARLAPLARARKRIFVAPHDGVTTQRVVDAVDLLVGAGFEEVALDPRLR